MNYCLWFNKDKDIWQIVDNDTNVLYEGSIEFCYNKMNELNSPKEEPTIIIE